MERSHSFHCGVGVCILILALAHGTQARYSGGTGEPNDPYQIATAADLIALGQTPDDYDKCFILTADIDLDPNLPGGKVFDEAVIAPIHTITRGIGIVDPMFGGVFDGNGHIINNLTIRGYACLGLFGVSDYPATIANLGLRSVNIDGTGYDIGGLVSYSYGSIANCHVVGTIHGSFSVGGLVNVTFGDIRDSFSAGEVSGGATIGGLAGYACGNICNSYSESTVTGYSDVGGLVGRNNKSIGNSYSTGRVTVNRETGYSGIGGLVGSNSGHVTSCFWDIQSSQQTTSAGGTGLTTIEMQTASTFLEAGWDLAGETTNGTQDIWWINEGKDYPRLWWERMLSDNFKDGQVGSLWMEYEPDPSRIRVEETNGRLEVYSSATADDIDAVYVSNRWRLDVSKDFALRVDFHHGKRDAGDSWVMVAFLPSVDVPVSQIITFEAGCMNEQPFYLYEAIDDAWRKEEQSDRVFDDGTLYASYDAAKDELYLSHTGYGQANAWRTITGLLAGRWQGDPVYVAVGGGSNKTVLNSGDAWLDNFIVNSGTLISPTPDDTAGLGD